jgi:GTP diphosphokinase / guanosine-3',5'-bis(diphosphate) 3'-diphosphatase
MGKRDYMTSLAPETVYFERLMAHLSTRPPADQQLVTNAFVFARHKHEGQFRKNGEPYIVHPVQVAEILVGIPADTPTVLAAIMHDLLEDTPTTPEEILSQFGAETLGLVEGVTKLGKIQFSSTEDRQSENFRRLFLSMAEDVRVVLLKLADRLHNMRTIGFLKPEKQHRIATETLEIFAPLANRMGMGKIRAELEDLALAVLYPEDHAHITTILAETRQEREDTLALVTARLQEQLGKLNLQAKITGRMKNLYSIYKKMKAQEKRLEDIYDISAVRIILNSEKECYEVLGIVHNTFTPIPGRFKDYIAMSKNNLYQSLHTVVVGPLSRPIEVQIRTEQMHRVAEYGIAAHWRYKEAGASVSVISREEQKLSWLKQMLEMKEASEDARDYVDTVKLDLFRDEVFVFTPKGKVEDLPKGSTPVDFAYRIHTEIGHRCTGAMVNGKIMPLNTVLRNGDIVDIMTSKKASPKLDWIKFVQTHTAKARIRQWFKHQFRIEHEQDGRVLLEAELTKAGYDALLKDGKLLEIAKEMNFIEVPDMLMALGYGEINPPKIINRLKREQQNAEAIANNPKLAERHHHQQQRTPHHGHKDSPIEGLKGLLYTLAKCCSPVPGDPIIGVVTRSRGVMVHRDDCLNLTHVNPDRKILVSWDGKSTQKPRTHSVRLEIQSIDSVGILAAVSARIAENGTNVVKAHIRTVNRIAIIDVTVEVADLSSLELLKTVLRKIPDVFCVKRQLFRPGQRNTESEIDG